MFAFPSIYKCTFPGCSQNNETAERVEKTQIRKTSHGKKTWTKNQGMTLNPMMTM